MRILRPVTPVRPRPRKPPRLGFRDSGLSLIELLVAISLMGVVVVGVVGLLGTMVVASDEAKTQAEAEAFARSAAEDVKAWEYADCTGGAAVYDANAMLRPRSGTGLEEIASGDVSVEYGIATPTGIDWGVDAVHTCAAAVAHRVSIRVDGVASNASAIGVVVKRRPCLLSRVPDPVLGNCP